MGGKRSMDIITALNCKQNVNDGENTVHDPQYQGQITLTQFIEKKNELAWLPRKTICILYLYL